VTQAFLPVRLETLAKLETMTEPKTTQTGMSVSRFVRSRFLCSKACRLVPVERFSGQAKAQVVKRMLIRIESAVFGDGHQRGQRGRKNIRALRRQTLDPTPLRK
jgi:hypothetical protein